MSGTTTKKSYYHDYGARKNVTQSERQLRTLVEARIDSLIQTLPIPKFRDRAACRGSNPNIWHPPDSLRDGRSTVLGQTKRQMEGLRICQRCPVRKECLVYALENEQKFGTWGGVVEGIRFPTHQNRGLQGKTPDQMMDIQDQQVRNVESSR